MQRDEMPPRIARLLTPPEVIAAYVERRVNDPSLLSDQQPEPTYADFLSEE